MNLKQIKYNKEIKILKKNLDKKSIKEIESMIQFFNEYLNERKKKSEKVK